MTFLLDVIEIAKVCLHASSRQRMFVTHCPQSHTGLNLAIAFAEVLNDFGVADKVRCKLLYHFQR